MPLLDTSHLIGLLRKDPASISMQKNLEKGREFQYISSITVFELTAGAYRSSNPDKNLMGVEAIKQNIEIIPVCSSFADTYATLVNTMRSTGERIGALDEILAATALSQDKKIVTRDNHFVKCPGLEVHIY